MLFWHKINLGYAYWEQIYKQIIMTSKNKKQFGVWMDSMHATIVGNTTSENGDFILLAHCKNEANSSNSSEKNANNAEKTNQHRFYKQILSQLQNAEEVHVTGPGTEQEQFIHYMATTAQFKNTVAKESTSNKPSDEKLIDYIKSVFK